MSTRYILEPRDPERGIEPSLEVIETAKRVADNYAAREAGSAPDEWCQDDINLWGLGFVLRPISGGGAA